MNKFSNKKGYALLFAVVTISIIMVIAFGISSATNKQLILSSLARNSQTAFYQSDLATECGLYYDWKSNAFMEHQVDGIDEERISEFNCGGQDMIVTYSNDGYTISAEPSDSESSDPCFRLEFEKEESGNTTSTVMKASGYNICNVNNTRTVERTIEVSY